MKIEDLVVLGNLFCQYHECFMFLNQLKVVNVHSVIKQLPAKSEIDAQQFFQNIMPVSDVCLVYELTLKALPHTKTRDQSVATFTHLS